MTGRLSFARMRNPETPIRQISPRQEVPQLLAEKRQTGSVACRRNARCMEAGDCVGGEAVRNI